MIQAKDPDRRMCLELPGRFVLPLSFMEGRSAPISPTPACRINGLSNGTMTSEGVLKVTAELSQLPPSVEGAEQPEPVPKGTPLLQGDPWQLANTQQAQQELPQLDCGQQPVFGQCGNGQQLLHGLLNGGQQMPQGLQPLPPGLTLDDPLLTLLLRNCGQMQAG